MRVRFRGIEGARGMAALMVFAFHLETVAVHADLGPVGWLVDRCWLGLTFFFVLSGFLLYRPFLAGGVSLRRYFVSRVARIVPAYWVVLVALTVVVPAGSVPHGRHLWANFLFLQLYGPRSAWLVVPAWTLCIEASFYLVLPLLAFLAAGRAWRIALLIPAGHLYAAVAQVTHIPYLTLGNYIDLFACGMLAAIAYERRLVGTPVRIAVALGAVGLALDPLYGRELDAVSNLLMAGCFAAVTLAIARGRLPFFSWRPVVGLGVISYGFYLWHFTVVQTSRFHGPVGFATAFVVLGLFTVLLATVSWYLIERPALAFARRLLEARQPVGDRRQPGKQRLGAAGGVLELQRDGALAQVDG